MSAKQEIISMIDVLPQNLIEEVRHYVLFLKTQSERNNLQANPVRPPFEYGSMSGKIWEADDHDWFEPLEDFREYME